MFHVVALASVFNHSELELDIASGDGKKKKKKHSKKHFEEQVSGQFVLSNNINVKLMSWMQIPQFLKNMNCSPNTNTLNY